VILRWTSLRSKVGRRLLLLFISCSIVPLVIALYLSFSHATDQLYQQSEARLRHESKSVGLAVFRELLDLASEFEHIEMVASDADDTLMKAIKPERMRHLREGYRALTIIDLAGNAQSLFGPLITPAQHGAEEAEHIASGKSLLSLREQADGSVRLMLESAVGRGNVAHVIAELDAEWLAQGARQALTIPQMAYCLLNSNEVVIVCSAPDGFPPPRVLPSGLAHSPSGDFRW